MATKSAENAEPSSESSGPVFLVTGCSTGFGRALVKAADSRGLRVIATARRLPAIEDLKGPRVAVLPLDVTASSSQLKEFAKEALEQFGKIDILINNAGYFLTGALEEVSSEEALDIFNTNFFGYLKVTSAILPHFRERRSGTIVNISSVIAYVPVPGAGIYAATKSAIDQISQTWALELAPFGIKTMGVNLGNVRTEIAGCNLKAAVKQIPDYQHARDFHNGFHAYSGSQLNDAGKAADRVLEVLLTHDELPAMYPLGLDAILAAEQAIDHRKRELEKWKNLGLGIKVDETREGFDLIGGFPT